MNDIAAEAAVRTRRDPVLTEAIRLLQTTTSQEELFGAVDANPAATQGPTGQ